LWFTLLSAIRVLSRFSGQDVIQKNRVKSFDFFVYFISKLKEMTTINLKKQLIQQISEIDDHAFLEAIKTILDCKSKIYQLSTDQKSEINKSKDQINQGLLIGQKELDEEFEKWANEN